MGKKKFNYAYVIIIVCALMVFVGLGFSSSSKKAFLNSILSYNTSISKALYGFSDTFRYATTTIVNVFFGSLIVKFGLKKLVGAGFIALTLSMLFYAISTTVIGFYLAGVFLGLGVAWTTTTMVGYIINKWCTKNKGTILGITLATNGFGASLATMVFGPIAEATPTGYKTVYFIFTIIVFAIGVISVIFLKDKTITEPQIENTNDKKQRGSDWTGIDTKSAYKKPYFYLCLISVFLTGIALQSITTIDAMHMAIIGVPSSVYTPLMSAGMFILAFSKFFTGFLYDRLGLRPTITISFLAAIVSLTTLCLITADSSAFACGFYFILVDVALPLETIILPIYASDLFGKKDYTKFLGIVISANTLGQSLGSPIMGLCFDIWGNYSVALYLGTILMAIAMLLMQYVVTASNKEKRLIALKIENQI